MLVDKARYLTGGRLFGLVVQAEDGVLFEAVCGRRGELDVAAGCAVGAGAVVEEVVVGGEVVLAWLAEEACVEVVLWLGQEGAQVHVVVVGVVGVD